MLVSFHLFTKSYIFAVYQTIFSLSSTPDKPTYTRNNFHESSSFTVVEDVYFWAKKSATNLCWRGVICCCTVRGIPCRRELWTPAWKAHVSAHALAECSAGAFWKLESNATRPLCGLRGTWVCSSIGSPWGLEHPAIGPWGSHHCRIHVVWW